MRVRFCVVLLALSLLACGCEKSTPRGPTPYPVQGKVLYKGQPVAGVVVVFHPQFDMGATKFAPSATTDQNGTFRLSSYAPDDGAPAGVYAVTFEWPAKLKPGTKDADDPSVNGGDQLQGRYKEPSKSRWKIAVLEGPNECGPFKID